jgi:hypothetical protein
MIIESYRDELNRKFTGVWGKENVFIDNDKSIIMRLFIIRLLLIALLWLLFTYAIHWGEALLIAYVVEYIFEPLINQYLH